ncbi:MAG: tetratricopeptide repeat protein [Bryobacteraceae bacterium]
MAVFAWPALSQPPQASLETALKLFNSGKYQQCFEIVSPYVQQHPDSSAARKILGMDQYMLGKPRDALQELLRATELNPKDADAFYYLGRLYFSADNAVAALAAFQKSLELDPSSVRATTQFGQTYEALGRMTDAERAYRKAIELEEQQPKKSEWPYYNLALLYVNTGHAAQSVPYFRQALARNPAFPEAKIKLAVVLVKQNLSIEAQKLLEGAIQDDPQNSEAHYRLALLLAKAGKREEAQQQFALFEKYRRKR